jgi:hypothetical protein
MHLKEFEVLSDAEEAAYIEWALEGREPVREASGGVQVTVGDLEKLNETYISNYKQWFDDLKLHDRGAGSIHEGIEDLSDGYDGNDLAYLKGPNARAKRYKRG